MARSVLARARSVADASTVLPLRDLVELIRKVNPTDRRLSSREQDLRYELKARLQSLLVNSFSEELDVVPENDEDIVLLRVGGSPACHARISSLDDDARALVRRLLDLGGDDGSSAPFAEAQRGTVERRGNRSGDPVSLGREALASYDFESARSLFKRAMSEPQTEVAGTECLLGLLVERLAADEEAIALESQLAPAVRKRERVRLLVAMALIRARTARRRGRMKAAALLVGIDSPEAMSAVLQLVHAASEAGAFDEAEAHLGRANSAPPNEVKQTKRRLAELRAHARRPLEDALKSGLETWTDEEAERAARELLDRWPDSRIARRVLDNIAAANARCRLEEALALADTLESEGALDESLLHWRIALANTLDDGGSRAIKERIKHIERAIARARAEGRAADILALGSSESVLEAYFEAHEDVASIVRPQVACPLAEILDQFRASSKSLTSREVVRTAIAWEEARSCLTHDVELALRVVQPHRGLLGTVPLGRTLLDALRAASAAICDRAFDQTHAAIDELDPERARESLRPVRGALTERAGWINETASRIDALSADLTVFEKLERDGAYPAARTFAAQRAQRSTTQGRRDRWLDKVERMKLMSNVAYEVEVQTSPAKLGVLQRFHGRLSACNLRAGTTDITVIHRLGAHIVGATVDTASRLVRRRFSLRFPSPGEGIEALATSESLLLLDRALCMRLTYDGEISDCFEVMTELGEPRRLAVSSDGESAWLTLDEYAVRFSLRGAGPAAANGVEGPYHVHPLRGIDRLLLVHSNMCRKVLCHLDGSTILPFESPHPTLVRAVAAHPERADALVVSWCDPPDAPQARGLRLHSLSEDGSAERTPLHRLAANETTLVSLRTARKHAATFLLATHEGYAQVVAFEPDGAKLRPTYSIRVPPSAVLVEDPSGERVFLLATQQNDAPLLLELTRNAP